MTFFDMLKYAKTGISQNGMTFFTKSKALALCGDQKQAKRYIYVGTDDKAYQGTESKVYASRKGA